MLNLDGHTHRREWMKEQLDYWDDQRPYSDLCFDGRPEVGDDLSDIIKGRYPDSMAHSKLVPYSHLKNTSNTSTRRLIMIVFWSWRMTLIWSM